MNKEVKYEKEIASIVKIGDVLKTICFGGEREMTVVSVKFGEEIYLGVKPEDSIFSYRWDDMFGIGNNIIEIKGTNIKGVFYKLKNCRES